VKTGDVGGADSLLVRPMQDRHAGQLARQTIRDLAGAVR
jgi:hypothetical protein